MATLKQFEANRRNAQKSTGPKTPEGKATVSMNALRHGLRARTVVLPGEDPNEFSHLCDDLEVEWHPASRTEQFYVEQMAVSQWKLCRMEVGEAAIFQDVDGVKNQLPQLDRLWQAQARMERSYARAQRELERLQTSRRQSVQQPEEPAQAAESPAAAPEAEAEAKVGQPVSPVQSTPPSEIRNPTSTPQLRSILTLMRRREFLAGLAATALTAQTTNGKPNIVFILADDLGYGDLGCYGQKRIQTPNIDRIAADGMRFTQVYAGDTVCAPSRCALMTGKHVGHCRIRGNRNDVFLQPSDVTVATVLKRAGYRTGIFGKWGLGGAGTPGVPNLQGFDEWFGYLDQRHAHTFYPDHLWENQREFYIPKNFSMKGQYSHDLLTPRAINFIEASKRTPFFLYLAYTIPHANDELGAATGNGMEVPDFGPYKDETWPEPEKGFAAMITRMDNDIGKLMASLKSLGLDENTLVIFSSDNGAHKEGGHDPEFFHSHGDLRGIKRDLYEGGIRVPTAARWPGKIKPGQVSDQVWAFWDFLPTAAVLAGAPPPPGLDGISMVNTLLGKNQLNHDYLYWEFHERGFSQAVRMRNWKGVRVAARNNPIELYDLSQDLGEKNNVAAQHPEIVAKIAEIMRTARIDSKEFPITERKA